MENTFISHIQEQIALWRNDGYPGIKKETGNILSHVNRIGFLHQPQKEALETYVYLKEVVGNKPSLEVFRSLFSDEKEMLLGLVSKEEAFDLLGNPAGIATLLAERFGETDYPNQVYALTMGAGKTILMATMMLYDFVLSFHYPSDSRFAKNGLVFAPDTTIIESLKEIRTFDYEKVLPKEYHNIILNLKYHYLETPETVLSPIGNYNIVISNSQKIILKTSTIKGNAATLFVDAQLEQKREIENKRLQAIRQLKDLAVFVDEAHHSYGTNLEGTLKKTRQTINYLHGNAPLVSVINLTGTPYINNRMIADVVYHYGLKQGIEKGILKQVRFYDYTNVKNESFIEDVVGKFWEEYGDRRLEERLPKIAFYASSIEELRQDVRPAIERALLSRGISLDKVLEYHTEAEGGRKQFTALDTPDSEKQFILLVSKGTEGWNCRSLVSTAMYRKPKSSIFVLQSSTRCLRSIGDNSTVASVFLSSENYRILDRELKNNFSVTIEELSAQDQRTVEHTLKVIKRKRVTVKKVVREIASVQEENASSISIDWGSFKADKYRSFVGEGGIMLGGSNLAQYREAVVHREVSNGANLTCYELVELISRRTHIPCLEVEQMLAKNGKSSGELAVAVRDTAGLVPFIIDSVLSKVYRYEETVQVLEEEVELAKMYPFKVSVDQSKNTLVVYREQSDETYGSNRLGFHINPYNFDSSDEKNLFRYLQGVLREEESVADIYFTGGATDPSHNDFYFEYWSPSKGQLARYFPDFLIETSVGRYLIIEVKAGREKETYEQNRLTYDGTPEALFDEVYAKEVGFREFQKANEHFEYRIVFDASLQVRQQEVLKSVKSL